jgi:peroxiredoxin
MGAMQQLSGVASLHAEVELAMAAGSGIAAGALRAGMRAPLFTLADAGGREVALERLLAAGPVVLHFFRGAWCGYGARSLDEFSEAGRSVAALGAAAVAIGPGGVSPAARDQASPVLDLRDDGMNVARAYGLAFNLPYSLRARYQRLGYRPPAVDGGADDWLVPVPAVYLLNRDGIVVLASVELDYRKRFDAAPLLAALKAISPKKREHRAQ